MLRINTPDNYKNLPTRKEQLCAYYDHVTLCAAKSSGETAALVEYKQWWINEIKKFL